MALDKQSILVTELPDSGRVLDQDINEWVSGWQSFFRLHKTFAFYDKAVITSSAQQYSAGFYCSKYSKMGLAVNFDFVGSTDYEVFLRLQFSDNGSEWYLLNIDPPSFTDDTTGNVLNSSDRGGSILDGEIHMNYAYDTLPKIFIRDVVADYVRVGIRFGGLQAGGSILTTVKGFFTS